MHTSWRAIQPDGATDEKRWRNDKTEQQLEEDQARLRGAPGRQQKRNEDGRDGEEGSEETRRPSSRLDVQLLSHSRARSIPQVAAVPCNHRVVDDDDDDDDDTGKGREKKGLLMPGGGWTATS